MVYAKCIEKVRNKNNVIVGYILEDKNGSRLNIKAEQLKLAIFTNQISVINLKLTKDGKLVDAKNTSNKEKYIDEFYNFVIYKMKDIHNTAEVAEACDLLTNIFGVQAQVVDYMNDNTLDNIVILVNNNIFIIKPGKLLCINENSEADDYTTYLKCINKAIKELSNLNLYNLIIYTINMGNSYVRNKLNVDTNITITSNSEESISVYIDRGTDSIATIIIIDHNEIYIDDDSVKGNVTVKLNSPNLKSTINKTLKDFIDTIK